MASVEATDRPMDELELVERARRGDSAAAEALLEGCETAVFRTCRHLLPRGEDAEGAAQETFVRALRSLHRYSGAGSFTGWVVAIAVNLCRDRMRRRRLVPFVALEDPAGDGPDALAVVGSGEPDPERVVMARQAVSKMHREVGRLPRRQREVFALRFLVGLDLDTIAAALGIETGSVKTHLYRAVHRVREAVAEARP